MVLLDGIALLAVYVCREGFDPGRVKKGGKERKIVTRMPPLIAWRRGREK